MTTEIAQPITVESASRGSVLRSDVLNLLLLGAGVAVVLLLISPQRSYPMFDDWAYAQGTKSMLDGNYVRHDWAVATSLVPIALGALFSVIGGSSFTTLTFVSLVFGALGIVCFYLLLRSCELSPAIAMLGTVVLSLNPLYVVLGYSFMTDIPFVALVLLACLLFVRGMQGKGEEWLWLGSIATALAYLTRQYGIILSLAALAYLVWTGQWSWRRAASVAIIPGIVLVLYALWESTQPVRLELYLEAEMHSTIATFSPVWFMGRAERITWVLSATGLFLMPVFRLPRRPVIALPLILGILFLQIKGLTEYGSIFPENGSIIDHTGFGMFDYATPSVLNEQTWTVLGILGGIAVAFTLANLGEHGWNWLRSKPLHNRTVTPPAAMIYGAAILLAGGIFTLTPFIFDRYILPLLPVLILAVLKCRPPFPKTNTTKKLSVELALGYAAVSFLAVFAVVGLRDYKEHATVRWSAAVGLLEQGIPARNIDAGFEWQGWNLYQQGANYIRESGDYSHAAFPPSALLDPVYLVSDRPKEGYTVISSVPYESWLAGWQVRHVLVLKRNSANGSH